ncbi:hypothetical protein RvY_11791, partial [Ramazzottius varieornatus]
LRRLLPTLCKLIYRTLAVLTLAELRSIVELSLDRTRTSNINFPKFTHLFRSGFSVLNGFCMKDMMQPLGSSSQQ